LIFDNLYIMNISSTRREHFPFKFVRFGRDVFSFGVFPPPAGILEKGRAFPDRREVRFGTHPCLAPKGSALLLHDHMVLAKGSEDFCNISLDILSIMR